MNDTASFSYGARSENGIRPKSPDLPGKEAQWGFDICSPRSKEAGAVPDEQKLAWMPR